MKICMFVNNHITRDPRVNGEANALVKAGHKVTIIGVVKDGALAHETINGIELIRINSRRSKFRKVFTGLKTLFRFPLNYNSFREKYVDIAYYEIEKKMVKIAVEKKHDVYHAHDLDTLRRAYMAAKETNTKLVYDSHELWVEWRREKCDDTKGVVDFWESVETEYISKADVVITVSDGIAARLQGMYYLIHTPTVLYNCAELKDFSKLNRLRDDFVGVDDERKIVLYQGGILSGRGLEAFVEIAKRVPEMLFVMIGPVADIIYYNIIKELSREVENVRVLDPVSYDELWQITCSADFGYVCTEPLCDSYNLGLSNKIFEYMTAGLPIFASKVAGHYELSNKLPEGLSPICFIDYEDYESSAKVIRNAAASEKGIAEKSENARKVAEDYYNREREFSKLVSIYEDLNKER